jgi:hypothetical protein
MAVKTTIDNPLLIAPYVELALVNLMNIKSNNDFLNTSIVILKAEAIYAVTVYGLKQVTDQERPNGENWESHFHRMRKDSCSLSCIP